MDVGLFRRANPLQPDLAAQVGQGAPVELTTMFNEPKTTHLSAYLLKRHGGPMRYIKLLKLLYLADRESLGLTGDPLTGDTYYGMKFGPVLSKTMNLAKEEMAGETWDTLIEKRGQYDVRLTRNIDVDDLDELSRFDRETLDRIYGKFGRMHWKELVHWTHKHCGEWTQPEGARFPIEPKAIFKALGRSDEEATALAARLKERNELDRVLSQIS